MGKKEPSLEVDPHYLPLGSRVGPWRVTGFRGRGAYGTLYRVEQVRREAAGPFALKLAIYPRDPRFEHEAQLLSIIDSPHVPQFIDYGVWEHPSGVYPYPQVSPELDALISRLLALAPEERFNGQARLAAEALEKLAHRTNSHTASPVFVWGYDHLPCVRSPEAAQLTAQRDAAARQELERRESEQKAEAATALEKRRRSAFAPAWAAAGAAAFLVLVLVTVKEPRGEPQAATSKDQSVSIGDSAMSPASSTQAPEPQGKRVPTLSRPLPEKPFPGQRQPPCIPRMEAAIRGVCWVELGMKPPCGNSAYEWEGKCYSPSMPQPRQPTSDPPE